MSRNRTWREPRENRDCRKQLPPTGWEIPRSKAGKTALRPPTSVEGLLPGCPELIRSLEGGAPEVGAHTLRGEAAWCLWRCVTMQLLEGSKEAEARENSHR